MNTPLVWGAFIKFVSTTIKHITKVFQKTTNLVREIKLEKPLIKGKNILFSKKKVKTIGVSISFYIWKRIFVFENYNAIKFYQCRNCIINSRFLGRSSQVLIYVSTRLSLSCPSPFSAGLTSNIYVECKISLINVPFFREKC